MIQFPDYVHAVHEDRRRAFEAAASRAAIRTDAQTDARATRWNHRRFRARRAAMRHARVSRTPLPGVLADAG